jgi:hypothetical protein
MKHQRHFEYGNRSREELQTRSLIADIDRIVQIIDSDIVAEEENASVFDRSLAEYPMLLERWQPAETILRARLRRWKNDFRTCRGNWS